MPVCIHLHILQKSPLLRYFFLYNLLRSEAIHLPTESEGDISRRSLYNIMVLKGAHLVEDRWFPDLENSQSLK